MRALLCDDDLSNKAKEQLIWGNFITKKKSR